jgi:phosphotriesterase-related protein
MTERVSRRKWLAGCLAIAGMPALARAAGGQRQVATTRDRITTVAGQIERADLGLTLIHEHVLVDFIGADKVDPSRYDADAVFAKVLPYLQQVKALGAASLVECTPAYLGRDPKLLARLSKASGLHILTNTGYYGARKHAHLPAHAFTETADQVAARWIREHEQGIDGTGIKPALMKIGVDAGPLSEVNVKMVRAAAIAHKATSLPIAAHTGDGVAAFEELDLIDKAGVPPSAFIWVHAQAEKDEARHVKAAARGAWVEFDGISEKSVDRHVALVMGMKAAGHLTHVLVSHDGGWYRVGEPGGGEFRPFDTLFTKFVPALKAAGATDADVRQLLVENPARALTGR